MGSVLIIEDLEIQYEAITVVRGLNLSVKRGEHRVIAGKSGSGKSSILHAVLGFIQPLHGRIFVDDTELDRKTLPGLRLKMAWLPPDPFSFPGEVQETMREIFDYRANRDNAPARNAILDYFERLGLEERIYYGRLEELSSGQKQRMGIAICLLLRRSLLLLDEPTSALDRENRNMVIRMINGLDHAAVLSVSHDEEWIAASDGVITI